MLEKKNNTIKWTYELDLYKNPTMAKNLCVLAGFFCLVMFSLSLLTEAAVSGVSLETFLSVLQTQLIFAIGLFILATVCYLIYCNYMIGKYVVSYKMNDHTIENIKEKQPVKKSGLVSFLLTIFGMNNKKGLTTSLNDNIVTSYDKVTRIIEKRKQDLIIVHSSNNNNQVFVKAEDYDEVLAYIKEHVKGRK